MGTEELRGVVAQNIPPTWTKQDAQRYFEGAGCQPGERRTVERLTLIPRKLIVLLTFATPDEAKDSLTLDGVVPEGASDPLSVAPTQKQAAKNEEFIQSKKRRRTAKAKGAPGPVDEAIKENVSAHAPAPPDKVKEDLLAEVIDLPEGVAQEDVIAIPCNKKKKEKKEKRGRVSALLSFVE